MLECGFLQVSIIIEGTWKGMHSTQTKIQDESSLTMIYIACIVKKMCQNKKADDNSPQDADKLPQ